MLVPGTSGAGKSTLTVTLVRAGFDFLSDDTVFLTPDDDGIVVSGFPDEIDVTEGTIAMFPELHHLERVPLALGREKHGFRVDEVFGVAPLGQLPAGGARLSSGRGGAEPPSRAPSPRPRPWSS